MAKKALADMLISSSHIFAGYDEPTSTSPGVIMSSEMPQAPALHQVRHARPRVHPNPGVDVRSDAPNPARAGLPREAPPVPGRIPGTAGGAFSDRVLSTPWGNPHPPVLEGQRKKKLKPMTGVPPPPRVEIIPGGVSYDVDLPNNITPEQAGYTREQIHDIRVRERARNAAKVAAGMPAHVYPPRTDEEKALIEANLEARAADNSKALVPWGDSPPYPLVLGRTPPVPTEPVIPASLVPHVADNVDRATLLAYIKRPAKAPSAKNGGSFRAITNSAYVAAATLAGPPR